MITRSKLSNQTKNKPASKFQPTNISASKPTKKHIPIFLLPVLLITVALITFGIMWLVMGGAKKSTDEPLENTTENQPESQPKAQGPVEPESIDNMDGEAASIQPITGATSANPTISLGRLMLINPNFTVESEFIATRKLELISLHDTYGIRESNSNNGDNLLDKEAAKWLDKMLADYTLSNPGHTMETRSCFREVGTNCGRMCAATGTSDHHTGLTCDLVDPSYGTILNTDAYKNHPEWQWLKSNSYRYGFIDRFPEAWAGGPMSQPANVDANGTTGLFETWHYRYVGVFAATEIATGVYNNGEYDSLEHYLKARGLVSNLLNSD